jgi:hypothetical protein
LLNFGAHLVEEFVFVKPVFGVKAVISSPVALRPVLAAKESGDRVTPEANQL